MYSYVKDYLDHPVPPKSVLLAKLQPHAPGSSMPCFLGRHPSNINCYFISPSFTLLILKMRTLTVPPSRESCKDYLRKYMYLVGIQYLWYLSVLISNSSFLCTLKTCHTTLCLCSRIPSSRMPAWFCAHSFFSMILFLPYSSCKKPM